MQIPTENPEIVLKQFVPEHAETIFRLIDKSREHLSQHRDDTAGKYQTLDDVTASIANPPNPDKIRMGIWDGKTFVGSVNLTPDEDKKRGEIGYYLGANHTGRGYATLAVVALTEYAFAQGFGEVYAEVAFGNNASARVLERAGYEEITRDGGEKRIFSRRKE